MKVANKICSCQILMRITENNGSKKWNNNQILSRVLMVVNNYFEKSYLIHYYGFEHQDSATVDDSCNSTESCFSLITNKFMNRSVKRDNYCFVCFLS